MNLYDAVFKRKSMRKFNDNLKISEEEMQLIRDKLTEIKPLADGIEVEFIIKRRQETNCKFNAEYCILAYTQEKPLWKENIGYMLEQLDLYLTTLNIGCCWYGMGRTDEKELDGKRYAIMFSFGKSDEKDFRTDVKQFDRKNAAEICNGELPNKIANAVRLAPSACNSQPWHAEYIDNIIYVYRKRKTDNVLTRALSKYFNGFDMGIFLFILEISLARYEIEFKRELFDSEEKDLTLLAKYAIVC